MNENIVELLLYLFENYIYDNEENQLDDKKIHQGLTQAGFASLTISHAFIWLEDLKSDIESYQNINIKTDSFRVFHSLEQQKIDQDCQDFILYLHNTGILNNIQREILINAIMKPEINHFDVDDLQWLALMVLFSQPDQEQAIAHLEALLFETEDFYEH
ncbi:MAG: DUF494 family protein [Marinicellaceae bacterium]